MPRPRCRFLAVADLRRGSEPGEAGQQRPCRKQALSAVETGCPHLPRDRLGRIPVTAGMKRGSKGGPDQLAARSQDDGTRADNVSAGWLTLFLPTTRHPSGRVRPDSRGTASARLLSCAEYSSVCGGNGVATAVPTPSRPGRWAHLKDARGAGRDTRCCALLSSSDNQGM
jgi:hypothetical protein